MVGVSMILGAAACFRPLTGINCNSKSAAKLIAIICSIAQKKGFVKNERAKCEKKKYKNCEKLVRTSEMQADFQPMEQGVRTKMGAGLQVFLDIVGTTVVNGQQVVVPVFGIGRLHQPAEALNQFSRVVTMPLAIHTRVDDILRCRCAELVRSLIALLLIQVKAGVQQIERLSLIHI